MKFDVEYNVHKCYCDRTLDVLFNKYYRVAKCWNLNQMLE